MVDTLSITYNTQDIDTDYLIRSGWNYRLNISGGQGSEVYFSDIKGKRYFYYVPGNILRVEFSVPGLLFGEDNNYMLVRAKDIIEVKNILRNDDVISFFNADTPNVSRVDYVLNFNVPDTSRYIQSFSNINVPRMTKSIYNESQTIFFRNSRRAIRIYDKYSECKREEAKNILRFEVQLRSKYLNDVLTDRSFDNVVNFQSAVYFLSDAFSTLKANSICVNSDTILDILFSRYRSTYASTLYGFYTIIVKHGIDTARRLYSYRTYYRYIKVFNSLGIRLYNDTLDTLDFQEAIKMIA